MAATIDGGLCERLVTAATSHCQAATTVAQHPAAQLVHEPNWDGVTTSLTALSSTFAWGSICLALVAIFASLGWGYIVTVWAEREAKRAAEKVARRIASEYIKGWLARKAPEVVREHVQMLYIKTPRGGQETPEDAAVDQIGEVS